MIHSSVVVLFPCSKCGRYCVDEPIGYSTSWCTSGYDRGAITGRERDLLFAAGLIFPRSSVEPVYLLW